MGKPKPVSTTTARAKRARAARGGELGKKKLKRRELDGDLAVASAPAASNSGSSDEEPLDNVGVPEGSSAFDSLLKMLGSATKKLASSKKQSERKQDARSNIEEDDDATHDSGSSSDSEDNDGGNECRGADATRHAKQANRNSLVLEQSDEDEYDASSEDEAHDMQNNRNDAFDEMEASSSFHCHVGHVLTNEEVNGLMKQKCKFKWKMPAVDIPKSKWVGTGEEMQGTYSDNPVDVKKKLGDHWQKTCSSDHLYSSTLRFFSLCSSYRDIMHCNKKPFYLKGGGVDSSIADAYIMHVLNHVHTTRDVVIKNDAKFAKSEVNEDILNDNSYLDQGFTRPKALFLLPLRSIALRVVKRLIQLSPLSKKDNVEYVDRLKKEFDETDDEDEETKHSSKPQDFQLLFAGNADDHFLLGIKFTKRSIKLYSDFYSSDIIVASPLGLKIKIDEAELDKEKNVDFLSSIEIAVVDHADVMTMQNWSHVNAVFEQLNRVPSKEHGTNVMRIRPWYLNGHARFYRQTILLGSYLTPDVNALFNRLCLNYEGKLKLMTEYTGVLPKILLEVRQVYERFDTSSIVEADDARFDYFCKKLYPKIRESDEGGVLLFISSYFEFIRIKNFLESQDASFCKLGEYTKQDDISRSRLWFFEGTKKIMLYTERSHFYHRYKIRGTKHLIIYSLPERKEFYPEIVNMLDGSKNMMCNVLYSRFDHLRLERIVGTSAARTLSSSDKNMFVFC